MAQAPSGDASPTATETLNLLIQSVQARMIEVQEARNEASDLTAAAEAVAALIEHVAPKATPMAAPAHQPAAAKADAPEEHKGRG